MILGLRPADFEDASLPGADQSGTIEVRADVVEELGPEMHVIFRLDAPPIASDVVRAAAEPDGQDGTNAP